MPVSATGLMLPCRSAARREDSMSQSPSTNEARLRQLFRDLDRLDFDAVAAHCAEDCVYDDVPYAAASVTRPGGDPGEARARARQPRAHSDDDPRAGRARRHDPGRAHRGLAPQDGRARDAAGRRRLQVPRRQARALARLLGRPHAALAAARRLAPGDPEALTHGCRVPAGHDGGRADAARADARVLSARAHGLRRARGARGAARRARRSRRTGAPC